MENVDLLAIRFGDELSVFYGRCLHRGALLADGHVDGRNLVCGVHNWDYRLQTGISEYANDEQLPKFSSWVEDGDVFVDLDESRSGSERTRNRTTGMRTRALTRITPAPRTSHTPG